MFVFILKTYLNYIIKQGTGLYLKKIKTSYKFSEVRDCICTGSVLV